MTGRRDAADDRRLFGDLLIEAGLVTRGGLAAGLEEQRLRGGHLGYALLKLGVVTPAAFHLFLKENGHVLWPDLVQRMRTSPAVDLIPAGLAHFYGMIPVAVEGGVLTLAVACADSPALVPAVSQLTGLRVDPLVCPPSLIAEALGRFYPAEVEPGVIFNAAGDHLFVLSDPKRGIRAMRTETLQPDAPATHWLRAIAAEAIQRGAKTLRLEPLRRAVQVTYVASDGTASCVSIAAGVYPSVAALLEGLSGLGTRRRVVPRVGRFVLKTDGRRMGVSVRALPGLLGETFSLALREERIALPSRQEIERDLPELLRIASELASARRGLLVVAGRDSAERRVGLDLLLSVLDDRIPRRIATGGPQASSLRLLALPDDEEEISFQALLDRALSQAPEILVLPALDRPGCATAALTLARQRVVVAPIAAVDSFAAVETMARRGLAADFDLPAGILGVRLMEGLCPACRRPYDLDEVMRPGSRPRLMVTGPFYSSEGCALCRGPEIPALEPVFEFLAATRLDGILPLTAQALREENVRQGMQTLFHAGLLKASRGDVDIKEPLRFLLHEQS